MANDGNLEPVEKLPEEDCQTLREIACQTITQALKDVKPEIIDQVHAYYYPPDPTVDERKWTFKQLQTTLGIPIRPDSVGKNIRQWDTKFTNNDREQIGLKFIEWKLQHTPDFPAQISPKFNASPGAYRVGKFVGGPISSISREIKG